MTKFFEIPIDKFPLNFDKYCQLRNQLQAAAEGFDDLGTTAGQLVSKDIMEVHGRLGRTWELIREIERREKEQ